jgi:hypothetical protein
MDWNKLPRGVLGLMLGLSHDLKEDIGGSGPFYESVL